MQYVNVFCMCCGDSRYSELLTRCNLKILLDIISLKMSTYPFFYKYPTTNTNPAYFIYCGSNVKVARYTLNDSIE